MTDKPIHGNYHGYYTKRQAANDIRLALIPKEIWKGPGARVLDIGCNEGWITCEIAQSLGVNSIIGVDIDDTLVSAAWRRRRTVWSCHGPEDPEVNSDKRPLKKQRMQNEHENPNTLSKYPAAFEHMYGPLPIPPCISEVASDDDRTRNAGSRFPHNVTFRTADWVEDGVLEDRDRYDVVLAFSLTKWVHLNGGDAGLLKFFRRVHSVLRPGGVFILEPQEWETYARAKRMDMKLRENAKQLQLRPDDFERVLQEIGFSAAEHLGTTGKGGFRRPVDLYRKLAEE